MRTVTRSRQFQAAMLAASLVLLGVQPTIAQTWPDKPLRVIVGFAAGGTTDTFARILQPQLTKGLGQPIVIENRPGAGTTIAGAQLAKAAPDGYTMMLGSSDLIANAHMIPNLPYDALKDMLPVSMLVTVPLSLAVHPSMPDTLQAFVAHVKARPGRVAYASPGTGSPNHLFGAIFMDAAGIDMVHVPYKGGGQVMADLTGGQVQATFISTAQAAPHSRSGKVRVLAVASGSGKRAPQLAQVPTFAEAGFPGYNPSFWIGLLLPAGTPMPIVERLNAEFRSALRAPEAEAKMGELGMEVVASAPGEMAALMRGEHESLGKVIRERKIAAN